MRLLRSALFFLLFGLVAPGCAIGPRITPVTDPTQRLQFPGFSILPPKGDSWFIVESLPTPPNWTLHVALLKKLRETIKRPSEFHLIYAFVKTQSLGNVTFGNRTELLQYLAQALENENRGNPDPRVRNLESKASLDKYLGWDCIRYEIRWESHNPPAFPGFIFLHTVRGFQFLHPDSSTLVIDISYSERYLRGQQSIPLEAEIEPFLRSLVFTPVR